MSNDVKGTIRSSVSLSLAELAEIYIDGACACSMLAKIYIDAAVCCSNLRTFRLVTCRHFGSRILLCLTFAPVYHFRHNRYGLTMQQGATALQQLGVQVQGLLSTSHYSFTPSGEVLGCYGRSIYSSCQPAAAGSAETNAEIVAAAAATFPTKTNPLEGQGKSKGSDRRGKHPRNRKKVVTYYEGSDGVIPHALC